MLAFYCDGEDIKNFMNILLVGNTFDTFTLHAGEVRTRMTFNLDGRYFKDFDGSDKEYDYCPWGQAKRNVFDLIKGKKLPGYIKLVLGVDNRHLEKIHENAGAAFLNIVFENNRLTFTTGTSQKIFSLDKSVDEAWDKNVQGLFKHLGIDIKPM